MKNKYWLCKYVTTCYPTEIEATGYGEALNFAKQNNDNINWGDGYIDDERFFVVTDMSIVEDY